MRRNNNCTKIATIGRGGGFQRQNLCSLLNPPSHVIFISKNDS